MSDKCPHHVHRNHACPICAKVSEALTASELAAPTGYAWEYCVAAGVQMWTWHSEPGLRYTVTHGPVGQIEAHVTTGTAYKVVKTIGAFATVKEAKAKCLEHWHNTDYATGVAYPDRK